MDPRPLPKACYPKLQALLRAAQEANAKVTDYLSDVLTAHDLDPKDWSFDTQTGVFTYIAPPPVDPS